MKIATNSCEVISYLIVVLIFISLLIIEVKHIFIYLMAICMSSLCLIILYCGGRAVLCVFSSIPGPHPSLLCQSKLSLDIGKYTLRKNLLQLGATDLCGHLLTCEDHILLLHHYQHISSSNSSSNTTTAFYLHHHYHYH